MRFSRYYEKEEIRDNSDIASSFNKYLNESSASDKLNTVEGIVEDLAKRTGLTQYINLINAELNNKIAEDKNSQDSLLDIKEVKDAVDEAIQMKHYNSSVNLLKKLEEQIKFNSNVPEHLKNVFSDKKLKEYIENEINQNKKEDHNKIDLLLKDNLDSQQQDHEPYFNFTSNENNQK